MCCPAHVRRLLFVIRRPEYLQALANGRPYADVNNTFPVTLNTSVPTLSGLILHAPVENGSTVPLRVGVVGMRLR